MTTHNHPALNDQIAVAIKSYVGKARGLDTARTTVLDLLVSFGWKSTDLLSPKSADSTATVDGYKWIKEQIVAGFTADVQTLLARETTKGLNQASKDKRKYWQQQIGARLNDLKSGLKKREQAASEGAGGKARSFYMIVDDQLATWEKRVKSEVSDADMQGQLIKAMRQVQALVRKAAKAG